MQQATLRTAETTQFDRTPIHENFDKKYHQKMLEFSLIMMVAQIYIQLPYRDSAAIDVVKSSKPFDKK